MNPFRTCPLLSLQQFFNIAKISFFIKPRFLGSFIFELLLIPLLVAVVKLLNQGRQIGREEAEKIFDGLKEIGNRVEVIRNDDGWLSEAVMGRDGRIHCSRITGKTIVNQVFLYIVPRYICWISVN